MSVPNLYHFIWIGKEKPFFLFLAIKSVLLRCQNARVTLWIDEDEDASMELDRLKQNEQFSTKKIDFEELANLLDEDTQKIIHDVFEVAGTKSSLKNTRPLERSRSNILRYMILYIYGGVYLDADTLTLKDLSPLLAKNEAFFGKENSIWPIIKRNNPFHRFIWAPFLEVFRFIACQLSFGYKLNAAYRFLCSSSENNAVLGFTGQHSYLRECFQFMAKMDHKEIVRPLRLGPFLFQWVSEIYEKKDFTCYPEKYFYPYGPLISQHFFRKRKHTEKVARYMISDETYVLHWGASTKFLKAYTRERILSSPSKNVFTLLAHKVILEYEANFDGRLSP